MVAWPCAAAINIIAAENFYGDVARQIGIKRRLPGLPGLIDGR